MNEVEGSTTLMAAVNLAKLCIGSGLLAIPYSFLRGGLLFSPLVIGLIAFWNGVSIFCFGTCTLAFPVEETMKNKNEFNKAVLWSLNLPTNSFIATLLRITMASVCLLGYPIVFNPPANMIETYCTVCSSFIPCFGVVVSLLGCFTVTILSFILPPLLHLQIVSKPLIRQTTLLQHHNTPQTTYITIIDSINKLSTNGSC
eukprot:gene20161-26174_t